MTKEQFINFIEENPNVKIKDIFEDIALTNLGVKTLDENITFKELTLVGNLLAGKNNLYIIDCKKMDYWIDQMMTWKPFSNIHIAKIITYNKNDLI